MANTRGGHVSRRRGLSHAGARRASAAQRKPARCGWRYRFPLLCHPAARGLPVGYLGTDAAAAAALWAAAADPRVPVAAIVCQDGRPDLAWQQLSSVRPPTLLIVGGANPVLLGLNRQARQQLRCESDLAVIPGAVRLLDEPGVAEQVAGLAVAWFTRHLRPTAGTTPPR